VRKNVVKYSIGAVFLDMYQLSRITPIEVFRLVAEYEEMSLDLTKRIKKYIITEKIKELAKPLPPKTQQLAKLKYVTPTFYYLLNQSPK
jgi:hypothetical protein